MKDTVKEAFLTARAPEARLLDPSPLHGTCHACHFNVSESLLLSKTGREKGEEIFTDVRA